MYKVQFRKSKNIDDIYLFLFKVAQVDLQITVINYLEIILCSIMILIISEGFLTFELVTRFSLLNFTLKRIRCVFKTTHSWLRNLCITSSSKLPKLQHLMSWLTSTHHHHFIFFSQTPTHHAKWIKYLFMYKLCCCSMCIHQNIFTSHLSLLGVQLTPLKHIQFVKLVKFLNPRLNRFHSCREIKEKRWNFLIYLLNFCCM